MSLYEVCQVHNILGEYPLRTRALYRLRRNLAVRGQMRRAFTKSRQGVPSRYTEGNWVRVLGKEAIQQTLDAQSRMRGLLFLPFQWAYCGGVYRVQKVMRSMIDDQGIFRPISRTVILEGMDCSGPDGTAGCGRFCPIMFRDEWIEPAEAPTAHPSVLESGTYARVRSLEEIKGTLDRHGKRDGLMFMPEMAQWVGKRFRISHPVSSAFENAFCAFTTPPRPVYILEGLQCSGAILGRRGTCDRACSILWHADWVALEA